MAKIHDGMKMNRLDDYRSEKGSRHHQKKYTTWSKSFSHRSECALLHRLLEKTGRSREILDAPCGAGRFFPVISNYTDRVHVGDISTEMLEVARAQTRGEAAGYECLDLRLPLPADATYEGVLSLRLTHHIYSEDVLERYFENLSQLARRWLIVTFRDADAPRTRSRRWLRSVRGRGALPAQRLEDIAEFMASRGLHLAGDAHVSRWFSGHRYALFIRDAA